jgi:endoribonuclease Dicer
VTLSADNIIGAYHVEQMLEAITTSKCQESFSLEGLELLGDAFLEVAVSENLFLVNNNFQEGKLSQLRTSIICNSALEKLGKECGIMVSTLSRSHCQTKFSTFDCNFLELYMLFDADCLF